MSKPAYINTGIQAAVRFEVEDSRGELVDVLFACRGACGETQALQLDQLLNDCLPWPAFNDWPDYDVHCEVCKALIHLGDS